MDKTYTGEGRVVLISGGGQCNTAMAARFVSSEKKLDQIIATPYDADLVRKIVESGHKAATEFDYFIFGIEGYSRVCEVQLVRKRHANYLIKTGRKEKGGKRSFDMVIPKDIEGFEVFHEGRGQSFNSDDILEIIELWYNRGVELGIKEEDLRYLKPQATEYKAIIGMNAHALLDWFQIRCCLNAQEEIRDMAWKMLHICKDVMPEVFENAGSSCKVLGYCPENKFQNKKCVGIFPTKIEAMNIIKENWKI